MRRNLYKYSDTLIVQTPKIRDYFNSLVPPDKIKIIPNPIKIVDSHNFLKKEKILLTVGRMDSNKNQEQIFRSFAKINPEGWKLIVCGDGPLRKQLENLADSLYISSKIEFTGYVKNIEEYYKHAAVFAFSSLSEGFPNVLLEAMNHGCACISTDCPTGPSELITHNINGYLVPVGNYSMYDKCLEQLIHNESELRAIHLNEPSPHRKIALVIRPNYLRTKELTLLKDIFTEQLTHKCT